MPQPRQPIHIIPATYITPISCPHCGAHAHLMRRTPHPEIKGAEVRTFECIDCHEQTEMVMKDAG